MNKQMLFVGGGLVGVLLLLCGGFYFLGGQHAVEHLSFKRVTPSELAAAMQGDHFYNSYRENTLIVSGQVAAVSGRRVTFKTTTAFQAQCNLTSGTPAPKVGSMVTLLTEAGAAQRQSNGVLLVGCTQP